MKKKYLLASVLSIIASFSFAQDVVDDTINAEAVDMPEEIMVSEDALMKDYNNKTNLSEGSENVRTLSYNEQVLADRLSRIPTTIEMPLNDVTHKFIDTYSNRMKSSVSIMLGSANFYNPIFEEALERYGLPLELKYLPVIESGLRPSATSRVGAAGLWQFMIGTGKRYGLEVNTLVDERRDPIKSSDAAARYLRDLYDMFGDWGLAIAAYNCGEGNVQKAIIRSGSQNGASFWTVYNRLPNETRGYVPAFIAATYIMNYYCEHGITPREANLPMESDTVIVAKDVKFTQIATKCGVTIDEIRSLNPQYRKDIVPAKYTLRLPSQAIEEFVLHEDSIYGITPSASVLASSSSATETTGAETAATVTETTDAEASSAATASGRNSYNNRSGNSYSRNSRNSRNSRGRSRNATKSVSVKSGDTLSSIAKKNGTTVDKLRKLNGIKGSMIHPGQSVRVK